MVKHIFQQNKKKKKKKKERKKEKKKRKKKKNQSFVYFLQCNFVQISPVCGPNIYQLIYGDTLDFKFRSQ